MLMLLLYLSILLLLPTAVWCDMMIPHPFLPYDHYFYPWPEPLSYPYILQKEDVAVLAVVSAGCLYLVHVSTQQMQSKGDCSVMDARAAIAEKLKMPAVRLWRVSWPWHGKKLRVEQELLDDDAKGLGVGDLSGAGGPRFLLVAGETDAEDDKPPEQISCERFNKLVTRQSLTCARVKHGFVLALYTPFCCILCIILLVLFILGGLLLILVSPCIYCRNKLRERQARTSYNDQVTNTGSSDNE